MSNPVLSEKVFLQESATKYTSSMTIRGTITKSLVLILMVLAGASYTWKIFNDSINPAAVVPWIWGGAIGGFIIALIISFKPSTSRYIAPLYALLEGLFLGGISAQFNSAFELQAPGIVMNAVLLTIATTAVMLMIYRLKIVKVDDKFRRVMLIAVGSIAFYYILSVILSLFGVNLVMLHDAGPLSIGISLVIVVVAALSLLVDFDFIEKASAAGAPSYMEWYGAFALMVTLIWLYLEILKLLAKFASRRE